MIERSLAVLSGIDPKLAEKLNSQLSSMAIDTVFVKFTGNATLSYFDNLLARSLQVSAKLIGDGNVRLTAMLISFFNEARAKEMEEEAFFPTLRRIEFETGWRKDINRSITIANRIKDVFRSEEHRQFMQTAAYKQDPRYLIPITNSKCRPLQANYRSIYNGQAVCISNVASRHIVRSRGKSGYRINDLTFDPALNDGTHPIRRRTNTNVADLKARFRFGLVVPDRFEFDVSGDKGLKGKSFALCDGSVETIKKEVSHLNMRINDDFREA